KGLEKRIQENRIKKEKREKKKEKKKKNKEKKSNSQQNDQINCDSDKSLGNDKEIKQKRENKKLEIIVSVESLEDTNWDEWISGKSLFSLDPEGINNQENWYQVGLGQIFRESLVEADELQLKAAENRQHHQVKTICAAVVYHQIQESDWLKEFREREGGMSARFAMLIGEAFGVDIYSVRRVGHQIYRKEENYDGEEDDKQKDKDIKQDSYEYIDDKLSEIAMKKKKRKRD
ncbi:MAG: hypothetical protein EZS28_054416, partial [Streblomastix strix]